jgi:hypothetical protein
MPGKIFAATMTFFIIVSNVNVIASDEYTFANTAVRLTETLIHVTA